jgi:pilus assembly protein CpaE
VPRRPEISASEFASSIECELIGQIPFDAALFGTAANNGQMIAEVAANNKINDVYPRHRHARHGPAGGTMPGGKAASLIKLPSFLKKRA